MHRTLARQLRRFCGIDSPEAWRALLDALPAAGALPGMPPPVAALLGGLEQLVEQIDRNFVRYEHDVALRAHVLELRSGELTQANARLRDELGSRNRTLHSVRLAMAELLRHEDGARALPPEEDLEGLSALLPDLVRRQQAGRIELINQRFALDQHAIVSIVDTSRRIIYVNEKFCLVTGYAREELLGCGYAVLDSGQHDASYFEQVWKTVESGQAWHGEVHNRAKGGRPYSVYATMVPFLDGDGRPYQYVSIETDITENKFLSEIVATSERQYRTLVNSLREAVFRTDARGCMTFVNPAWTDITGYTVDETLGHACVEFIHPDDLAPARLQLAQLLGGRAVPLKRELRCRTRDGGLCWLGVHVRAELGEDGQPNGLSGTLHDVSERRRAAEQIQENLSFVDALFDSIPLPVSLKDADGRYLRVNQAYLTFFSTTEERLRGKSLAQVVPSGNSTIHAERDREVLASGVPQIYQDTFRMGDGRPVDLLVSKALLRGADGRARGVIGVVVDVTTQAEAVRALRQAKEAADAASRAKSDFLANMSHEIRTPLNSVIGMTLLALKAAPSARLQDYLGKIRLSGEHLLGLIDDILDFSKIEAGMLTLEYAPFDPAQLLAKVLAQVAGRASAKGLRLDSAVAPELSGWLRGDGLRLSQVLINLVGNAVKFTDAGAVGVAVTVRAQDPARCSLLFEVRDSGIGISAEQLGRLFQSFHQADSSTTRKYGGTGLGLAICKRLVEQMGGELGVDSIEGQGSRFWFALTLERAARPAQLAAPPAAQPQTLHGMRVLVVDDHEFNQQVAREFLELAGVEVALAGNGMEALAQLALERYDCVLMDVQMPVMDGIAATRRMRADPALAGVRVIAMTANVSAEDRARCQAAGMDEFISKPVAPEKLYATLAGRAASGAAPAEAEEETEAEVDSEAEAEADISLAELARHFDGKPARMRQFALRYLETAGAGIAQLEAALAGGDLATAAALGHRYKSSARAVGALRMARQWQALEQPGGLAAAAMLAADLGAALERFERWVAAELAA
ncbi:PAS domain S-box protein [Pseudoduganella sp. LjRoot289]|uniref:PAS domain-containing hybrid sensor histidine kinase/response regulator n=1 Tax=Pseudoduganella sp. LjRoot289 TaxID=3342314 RepID=UPI003ECCE628